MLGEEQDGQLGVAVAAAGDVDADGFGDTIVGQNGYDFGNGRALAYGNAGPGSTRLIQQRRTDDAAPIVPGGLSDSPSSFLVKAVGRSPEGRTEIRMEVEVKPADVPFDGAGTLLTDPIDTGFAGVNLDHLVTGLEPEAAYKWRMRTVSDSPYFPHSPWFSLPGNAPTETDLRTRAGASSVDPPAVTASAIRLAPARPNPFRASTSLAFEIGQTGRARVAIYDVAGRREYCRGYHLIVLPPGTPEPSPRQRSGSLPGCNHEHRPMTSESAP